MFVNSKVGKQDLSSVVKELISTIDAGNRGAREEPESEDGASEFSLAKERDALRSAIGALP